MLLLLLLLLLLWQPYANSRVCHCVSFCMHPAVAQLLHQILYLMCWYAVRAVLLRWERSVLNILPVLGQG
jgi:hypothetical protein